MIIHDHEQNTPAWIKAKLGVPSGSGASNLLTSKAEPSKSMNSYADQLAIELYTGEQVNWGGNEHTEFGHEMEPESRSWYAFEKGVDPVETSFITDDLGRYGASPDSLVGNDGLAEFKNLPKQHVKTLLYWKKHKRPPTDYIMQCHMQMLVTDRAWCDLVYYNKILPRLIIRIERDSKIDDALKAQITACIQKRDDTLKILNTYERPEAA